MENLNKLALTNGIVIGVISIALQLLIYYLAPNLLGSMATGFVLLIVSTAIYVFFMIDIRKKIGGFWSFKQAFSAAFIMSFIANVGSQIFNFIYYKFIEPGAYDKVVSIVTESSTATFEKMGMNQEGIDKAIEGTIQGLKAQYQPDALDLLKSFAMLIVMGVILSLIFGAIFKKNEPVFAPIEDAE